ncbi:C-type isolectin Sp-CL4-like [Misgurnus anguillicaudatus]|uniref:C-type isolectin Sp-CL4-like n=1 Tax=Misgurnus anguillicaudatus TaxID=75329 RepID=UPI003CCFC070
MAVFTFLMLLCLSLSSLIAGRLPSPYDHVGPLELYEENPPCWPTWVDTEDRCYKLFKTPKTWHEALAYCKMANSNLTSVRNNDDLIVVKSLMRVPRSAVWIGGTDAVTEGTWQWSDGTPFDWTFWSPGQPDNRGEEDCMSVDKGLAYDENCSKRLPFVCATKLGM